MKNLQSLSLNAVIIIIVVISSAFTSIITFSDIPFQEGILNGDFSVTMNKSVNKISDRTLEGQFKNNQKVGSWKLFDKDHKLLQERIYKNNFEYNIIKDKKEVESKYPLVRNENGIFPSPDLKEEDIVFAQKLWKIITPEYLETNISLGYAIGLIDYTSFQAYTNYDLTKKDSTNQISTVNFSNLMGLRIMGDWYYDTNRKISGFQVLAISPVINEDDRQFWFYYPDMRLSNSKIEAESNNRIVNNLDDIIFFGDYPSLIYMIEDISNKTIPSDLMESSTLNNTEYRLMIEAAYWLK